VNLICYVDETGTHDPSGAHPGSEVVAVAGYLSWQEDWQIFCGQWQEVLYSYQVPVFHMSEFNAVDSTDPKWPYRGWSRDKKDSFIHKLIPIARDNTLSGIVGLVSTKDYDNLVPIWMKEWISHPYFFCFQLFFDCVLSILKEFEHPFPPEQKITFILDQQQQFKNIALSRFDAFCDTVDKENRFGSITFANNKDHPPLQAADLLAFRMRKMLTRKFKNQNVITEKGSWDDALLARKNVYNKYHDAETLKIVVSDLSKILSQSFVKVFME
jgi:hypothetical protein